MNRKKLVACPRTYIYQPDSLLTAQVSRLRKSAVRMSLLELGPVIFGGTDAIISFLRTNGLLSTRQNCIRCNCFNATRGVYASLVNKQDWYSLL